MRKEYVMGYGAVLRERFSVIRFLVEFQKTVWYPILFAVLCIISGSSGCDVYLPIIYILCGFVIFSALFADDNKVFLTPILMIYYSMGMDDQRAAPGASSEDSLLSSFAPGAFNKIVICGIVVTSIFIVRMIADGSVKAAIKQRRVGAVGIIALDIALLANGLFNPAYPPMTLLYGGIIAFCFTFFYFVCSGMLSGSKDFIPYACRAMVCTAYATLFQFIIKAYRVYLDGELFCNDYFSELPVLNRALLSLSWGLPTIVGAVFVLGIPAALYLAKNCKYSIISYISALIFLLGAVMINTRSAILVGAVAVIVCSAVCCLRNRESPRNAIYCRVLFSLFLIGVVYVAVRLMSKPDFMDKLLVFFRFDEHYNSSRLEIWERAWGHFVLNPVFGSGFDTGSNITSNLFSNMYHCIILQFLGSMGVIGIAAFAVHIGTCLKIFFKNFSTDKLLLLFIPIMILGMSLVDNFYFYPNFQIFYCVFIVLAEYMLYSQAPENDKNIQNSPKLPDIA